MDAPRFAAVPLVALADRRLTFEQMRVLIALLSFASKDSSVVFPSRQAISELTGMHLANISSATTSLERLGWLKKNGKGGYSKATRYMITVPNTVAEQATVAQSATEAEQVTGPVADSARGMCVAESARGKEHTSEHTNRTHKGVSVEPEGFAECWSAYPKREGGNSQADALKAYRGRLKAGVTPADMLAGVKRYAAYCTSKVIVGTPYVKQAATFFGPGDHWRESWSTGPVVLPQEQRPKLGDTRARHGITETFNEVAGWVPA